MRDYFTGVGIGLYGLLAFTESRRVNEIGVRMALGVTKADITRMILTSAAAWVGVGLLAGAPLAYWGQRLAENWVANLHPAGILPIASAAIVVMAVAMLSALVPVHRAASINPADALRRD